MHRAYAAIPLVILTLAAPAVAQDASQEAGARYLEVPLKGGIGKEITAPGVRNALKLAHTRKATHVVFLMDTPGGRVADAKAIGKVLDDDKGDLTYCVVVQRSFSAGMYIVARADHVYYTESGASGAAVSFKTDVDTGSAQVDAKMNAAWSADLATTAESHGQSGAAYRAMVIQDACLYAVKDASGKVTLSDQQPATGTYQTIDTAQTIFAPTARVACDLGMGTMLKSANAPLVGEALGAGSWSAAAPATPAPLADGARMVESRHAECERHRTELQRQGKLISDISKRYAVQLKIAARANPRVSDDIYSTQGGMLTAASQVKWREQTDACMREYNTALALLDDVGQAESRFAHELSELNKSFAKECEARAYLEKPEPIKIELPDDRVAIADHRSQIEEIKSKLAASRVRSRL
jgi:hypothetical protein